MKMLRKILALDIGAGTQDILLYDATLTPENCISLILPTPTRYFAQLIEQCDQDLFIDGNPIGGGVLSSRLAQHIKRGYRVIMTEEAAYTVRNNLKEVEGYGIEIARAGTEGFKGTTLRFHEINLMLLKDFLAHCGEDLNVDLVAIAVQDHGMPPEGTSNREFRFNIIEEQLKRNNLPEQFVYTPNDIPSSFKRMNAAVRAVKTQHDCAVVAMDTSFAAILGCMDESPSAVFVNVGNSHTLAALIRAGRIEGLLEHHTSCLTTEKLDNLLVRFLKGEVRSRDVLADGGHGAILLNSRGMEGNEEIIVTGPRRGMLEKSRLKVRFAAPHGNMMLTGPFGLVKGAYLRYGSS
jgi:uncharacterized protein (DUF1786 family)